MAYITAAKIGVSLENFPPGSFNRLTLFHK